MYFQKVASTVDQEVVLLKRKNSSLFAKASSSTEQEDKDEIESSKPDVEYADFLAMLEKNSRKKEDSKKEEEQVEKQEKQPDVDLPDVLQLVNKIEANTSRMTSKEEVRGTEEDNTQRKAEASTTTTTTTSLTLLEDSLKSKSCENFEVVKEKTNEAVGTIEKDKKSSNDIVEVNESDDESLDGDF